MKFRVAICTIVLVVVLSELFARLYLGLGDPPISIRDADVDYMFAPNQQCRRFGNKIQYNNLSMRCGFDVHASDGQSRIYVVGDSVINGGVLTDQSDLATSMLQENLKSTSGNWQVCNVSAGSWGPGNYAAYFRKYHECVRSTDVLVVEVNSHDLWEDDPSQKGGCDVGKDIALPDHKPWCALWDGFHRYFLPLMRQFCGKAQINTKVDVPKWQNDAENEGAKYNLSMLEEVFALPCSRKALLIYRSRKEAEECVESVGERAFRECAEKNGIHIIMPILNAETDYRDKIHPTVSGQKKIADSIRGWL